MLRRFDEGMVSLLHHFEPTIAGYHKQVIRRVQHLRTEGIRLTRAGLSRQANAAFNTADTLALELTRSRLEVPFSLLLDHPPIPPQQIPLWYETGGSHVYVWEASPGNLTELVTPPAGQKVHPILVVQKELVLLTGENVSCGVGGYSNHHYMSVFWHEDIRNTGSFLTKLTRHITAWVKAAP